MKTAEIIDYLKDLVERQDYSKVIPELKQIANTLNDTDLLNNVISLSARYNRLLTENAKGIIRRDDFNIELAKIRQAALYYIDKINHYSNIEGFEPNFQNTIPKKKTEIQLFDTIIPLSDNIEIIELRKRYLHLSGKTGINFDAKAELEEVNEKIQKLTN